MQVGNCMKVVGLKSGESIGLAPPPRHILTRMRFQLPVGLALAVVLPGLVRSQSLILQYDQESLINAMIGAAIAVVGGYFASYRFGDFPGVRSGSNLLVCMTAAFGIVIALFFMMRLDYSRSIFASSYVISLTWFVLVHRISAQYSVPEFALLPGGNAESMVRLGGAVWTVLDAPSINGRTFSGVVADLRHDHDDESNRFLANCALAGLPVYHTKQLIESLSGKVDVELPSENSLGSLSPDTLYLKLKRGMDTILAVLALPVLLAVVLVVGPLILLASGWPLVFSEERVGRGGRQFHAYKLRTTRLPSQPPRNDAIEQYGGGLTTGIGRILLRYRIDELPQILNILFGDMSWIGPRPEAPEQAKRHEANLPFYRYRHLVRPGITGWARVNRGSDPSAETPLDEVQYDFFYIKHISAWLDLLIAAKTLRRIFNSFKG